LTWNLFTGGGPCLCGGGGGVGGGGGARAAVALTLDFAEWRMGDSGCVCVCVWRGRGPGRDGDMMFQIEMRDPVLPDLALPPARWVVGGRGWRGAPSMSYWAGG